MSKELKYALIEVIDYLDRQMEQKPSRELADVSNYLQEKLNELNEEGK